MPKCLLSHNLWVVRPFGKAKLISKQLKGLKNGFAYDQIFLKKMMHFRKLYIFSTKIIRTHNYQNISFLTQGICPQSAVANNACNITGNTCNSNAECPSSRLCCEDKCGTSCKLPGISFIHYICVMLKRFSLSFIYFRLLKAHSQDETIFGS